MLVSTFSVLNVSAEVNDSDSVTAKFLNCNVAGLPDFKSLIGMGSTDVKGNTRQLGAIFNSSDFDVIATQEDFNYHRILTGEMKNYKYSTGHSGGVPGGDGLNIFTKNIPIYNETRQEWNACFGGIGDDEPHLRLLRQLEALPEIKVWIDAAADHVYHLDAIDRLSPVKALEIEVVEAVLGIQTIHQTAGNRLDYDYGSVEICLLVGFPYYPVDESAEEIAFAELYHLFGVLARLRRSCAVEFLHISTNLSIFLLFL